jgi:hypothetical protein
MPKESAKRTEHSEDRALQKNGDIIPTQTEDLRNHLTRSLPDYLIPSFFVYLDQIPLTRNGKVEEKVSQRRFA